MAFSAYASEPEMTVADAVPLGFTESVPAFDIGPRKMALMRIVRLKRILKDSLVTCVMLPYSYQQLTQVTAAVTVGTPRRWRCFVYASGS